MKEFSELKNKNQYWVAEKKTMSKRIKQLKVSLILLLYKRIISEILIRSD